MDLFFISFKLKLNVMELTTIRLVNLQLVTIMVLILLLTKQSILKLVIKFL